MRRLFWIERIVEVERLYSVARTSVRLLREQLQGDPAFGQDEGWRQGDAMKIIDELEKTFVVRLYAVFESGLRDY